MKVKGKYSNWGKGLLNGTGMSEKQWCDSIRTIGVYCGNIKKQSVKIKEQLEEYSKVEYIVRSYDNETGMVEIEFSEPIDKETYDNTCTTVCKPIYKWK